MSNHTIHKFFGLYSQSYLQTKTKFWYYQDIVKDGVFYGRYWGCLPGNDIPNLHFEACYWSAIEYCIANNIRRMEPGAGGGGT
jgi:predicted N-acyltransferase